MIGKTLLTYTVKTKWTVSRNQLTSGTRNQILLIAYPHLGMTLLVPLLLPHHGLHLVLLQLLRGLNDAAHLLRDPLLLRL